MFEGIVRTGPPAGPLNPSDPWSDLSAYAPQLRCKRRVIFSKVLARLIPPFRWGNQSFIEPVPASNGGLPKRKRLRAPSATGLSSGTGRRAGHAR